MAARIAGWSLAALIAGTLAGCAGTPSATVPTSAPAAPTAAPAAPTNAPAAPTTAPDAAPTAPTAGQADLSGIKAYLVQKADGLQQQSAALKQASDRYYELAKAANFDYAVLWRDHRADATAAVLDARKAWMAASPGYEQMEGIVAGTPSLEQFDVDLDAGSSAAEGGDNVVSFDLSLPNGTSLPKPGNLFGVTESTLWGTEPSYRAAGVQADLNGNGSIEFDESLPDANVLKGGADTLAAQATALAQAARSWQPTEAEAFRALVVMIPTMNEYFDSWKHSRFVAGDKTQQRDFVAISRLSDIQDILGSLQVVHDGVSPLIKQVDTSQDRQIGTGLTDLRSFVADIYKQEQGGKRFTPEEADLLGAEAQNRATAITGQVSQAAARLKIAVEP